jgi:hypothetical protein
MRRATVIDVSKDLPARARGLAADSTAQIFGGCLAQGKPCRSPRECCQVYVPNGGYVLCYFYRGHGDFVAGYCTTSYAQYG